MKVLITGITGFAGSHLAEFFLNELPGTEVYGIRRWRSRMENVNHILDRIKLVECDLRDLAAVTDTLEDIKPDRIFHLAAQSFVPSSWKAPAETITTNIIGNLNIYEAVRRLKIDPLIQVACSSEEYGMVHENEVPIRETNPLRPLSPYGVSKVGQDMLSYQYFQSYGIKAVRTRAFNHTGPRRGDVFVTSNFAKQVASIEKGLQEPVLHVGNLEAKRDFTDVRDMVRGYHLALEKGEPGEVYNIASGTTHTIQSVVDMLVSFSGVKIKLRQDPDRMRPSDVLILLGDHSKFTARTGWEPTIPIEKTLEDLLNYWRERIK